MTEQERLSHGYRDYIQSCGVTDPVALDEIEEAYYEGMIKQKEILKANLIWHCNNITEEQYNLESDFIDRFIDEHNRMPTFLDAIEYGMSINNK